jgi:hypothetical protein
MGHQRPQTAQNSPRAPGFPHFARTGARAGVGGLIKFAAIDGIDVRRRRAFAG